MRGRFARRLRARDAVGVLGAVVTLVLPFVARGEYAWNLPPGFPAPKVPADNPMTVEKVELGRRLFYERRLSGNLTQSCGTCHQQRLAFTDGRAQGRGSTGELHPRGPSGLTNSAFGATLTWANSLLRTFEAQALVPLFGENPTELGMVGREDELLQRLHDDRRYPQLFRAAFPDDADSIRLVNIVRALGSFERTLISGDSPYDRFVQGIDRTAMSASAIRGGKLFFSERLECFHCHGGFNFSDSLTHAGKPIADISFHNNALYNIDGHGAYPPNNIGLEVITSKPEDMGRFKPPTLRNIAVTAPYMHDGSMATLGEVIDHYAAGGRTISSGPYAGIGSASPLKSDFIIGFTLTPDEKADLIAFLESLTDETFLTDPRFSDPFANDPCPGDCNASGDVTVDDILYAVNVALGAAPLTACMSLDENADGMVDVAELLGAVNRSLAGCK